MDGLYKADASKVAEELLQLGDEYSLSDVVQKARNEDSEMVLEDTMLKMWNRR